MYSPIRKSASSSSTSSASAGEGAGLGASKSQQKKLTPWLIAIGVALMIVLGAGLSLRLAVTLLNDAPVHDVDGDVRVVSSTAAEMADANRSKSERLREDARQFDRKLLRERRDRKWYYETKDIPDADQAHAVWQKQVDSIQKQLDEAEEMQRTIEENDPDGTIGPLSEDSVLWQRKKKLERLLEDAPEGR
ncbi:hypothetical protein SAMN06265222_104150 [Neorhodopirellula lusitana]|uniref:Uncharacterized protein n=1 Tax=Neorhodopirellula lusitana TaxID=445327 RepID=A0ABY1Q2B6_9BACT|nr:hypothetical protein [Neorhodopirellula lusitana]SMP53763.1 hypothetical protein SAMN06265222_104150 [Neorhodopirellula lusitana]